MHRSIRPPTYIEVIPHQKDPNDKHRLVVLVGMCNFNIQGSFCLVWRVWIEMPKGCKIGSYAVN